jgi:general secretion pathway protein L
MNAYLVVKEQFSRWIDAVAETVCVAFDHLVSKRTVKLVEQDTGEFLIELDPARQDPSLSSQTMRITGGQIDQRPAPQIAAAMRHSRIDLVLRNDMFLFRPLEFPARAADFLDGIMRSQIDRLTPWNITNAAFGWSNPIVSGTDRIAITMAATALDRFVPYVQALAGVGAQSIAIFTSALGDGSSIKVWEVRTRTPLAISRMRRTLMIILAISGLAAGAAVSTSVIVGATLDTQQRELAQQIAAARRTAGAIRLNAADPQTAAQQLLERRKQEMPSTVMILEALSQILPDHTYVTELRVEANKVRLIGITRDAPSLIELLERSELFSQATFFAPTTQSASSLGENFHIETIARATIFPPS